MPYKGISDTFFFEVQEETNPLTHQGKELIYHIFTRVCPITGTVSKISKERADEKRSEKSGLDIDLDIKPSERCTFCDYEKNTPEPRIKHENGAISFPNLYPWEKQMWVTAYPPFDPENSGHKLLLSDFAYDDMDRMIHTEHELANVAYNYRKNTGAIGFRDFTNWGPFAGASQQHPHSQRGIITGAMGSSEEIEAQRCRILYEMNGKNAFDTYMDEERRIGKRIIHDGNVFISAAFSPKCDNEILVVPKTDVTHILEMDENHRQGIIRPVLGLFPAKFYYEGVTNLNIVVHMAPFDEIGNKKIYRWHMHIYPRKSRLPIHIAGAELGYGDYVISAYPEDTAAKLRPWFVEGPNEELVLPELKEHFRKWKASK